MTRPDPRGAEEPATGCSTCENRGKGQEVNEQDYRRDDDRIEQVSSSSSSPPSSSPSDAVSFGLQWWRFAATDILDSDQLEMVRSFLGPAYRSHYVNSREMRQWADGDGDFEPTFVLPSCHLVVHTSSGVASAWPGDVLVMAAGDRFCSIIPRAELVLAVIGRSLPTIQSRFAGTFAFAKTGML